MKMEQVHPAGASDAANGAAEAAAPVPSRISLKFTQTGDFEAMRTAEKWCDENGISVGRSQAGSPRGLMYGDFDIQKWRNLDSRDVAGLNGRMTGDMRNGPVFIDIAAKAGAA